MVCSGSLFVFGQPARPLDTECSLRSQLSESLGEAQWKLRQSYSTFETYIHFIVRLVVHLRLLLDVLLCLPPLFHIPQTHSYTASSASTHSPFYKTPISPIPTFTPLLNDANTHLRIRSQMAPHPHPLPSIDRIRAALRARGRHRGGVGVLPEAERGEALEEADEHE